MPEYSLISATKTQRSRLGEPARYAEGLYDLGNRVYAWMVPNGSWGESNSGLIVGEGAALKRLPARRAKQLGHYFYHMLAPYHYISRSETLYPGEFIGSGTCSGAQDRGCGLEMGKYLSAGDVVELEVETIEILKNTIVGK